jgi:hypothetical protein
MAKSGKIGYVDTSLEREFSRIRNKFQDEGMSDRQASKIMADIFREVDFEVKIKKRRKKFEVMF